MNKVGLKELIEIKTIVIAIVLVLVLFAACGEAEREPTAQELALKAAEESYEALYSGHVETFLNTRAGADSFDADYRQMLLAAYTSHALQVNTVHHGMDSIRGTRAVMDSTLNLMQTFLTLYFADGTTEEIVVPMVKQGDSWMLK